MNLSRRTHIASAFLALTLMFAAGCKKKVVPPPPPAPTGAKDAPPAPAKRPGVQFSAEPASIARGEAATLRWTVTDADSVRIEPGVGAVQASGSRQVFPSSSTSYKITATGAGGTTEANAYVNVSAPAAAPPPAAPSAPKSTFAQAVAAELSDVLFDYNSNEVREDARAMLQRNAEALKRIFSDFSTEILLIEGHCDERGSAEYNLGLGDRRATSVREFLTSLGIPANRMRVVSYGKERPQCTDASEDCWQKNRRAHFGEGQ
jgi:peptidoglycan-associated lipoprotein